jgi:hypothetical protein
MKKAILLCLFTILPALATIDPGVRYEVRTTGSDANGGGFVCSTHTWTLGITCASGVGTDWSQQAAPQYALTGLTTSAASATVLTSLASADMANNIIQITGGTNFIQAGPASTTSFYQITSVSPGTSITLDRAATTGIGAAGTGNIGGALLSPGIAAAQTGFDFSGCSGFYNCPGAAGNVGSGTIFSSPVVFIQYSASAVYPIISASLNVAGGVIQPNNSAFWVGYDTALNRFIGNSGNRPTIQIQVNNVSAFLQSLETSGNPNIQTTYIMNLIVDGNSGGGFTGTIGINCGQSTQYGWIISHCKVMNTTSFGIWFGNVLYNSEVTNCGTATTEAVLGVYGAQTLYNWIHNNPGYGSFSFGPDIGNIYSNNGKQGMATKAYGQIHNKNIFYGNGGDGLNTSTVGGETLWCNISESNTGYGYNDFANMLTWAAYNFAFGNTTATSNQFWNPMNIGGGAIGTSSAGFITTSGSVFVNAAGNNFNINTTAAGLALRAACGSYNGPMPDGLTVGYDDSGPMQHKDSAVVPIIVN